MKTAIIKATLITLAVTLGISAFIWWQMNVMWPWLTTPNLKYSWRTDGEGWFFLSLMGHFVVVFVWTFTFIHFKGKK